MGIEEFPIAKSIDIADLERMARETVEKNRRLKLKRIAADLAVKLHSHDTIIDDLAVIASANTILEWLDCNEKPKE